MKPMEFETRQIQNLKREKLTLELKDYEDVRSITVKNYNN